MQDIYQGPSRHGLLAAAKTCRVTLSFDFPLEAIHAEATQSCGGCAYFTSSGHDGDCAAFGVPVPPWAGADCPRHLYRNGFGALMAGVAQANAAASRDLVGSR